MSSTPVTFRSFCDSHLEHSNAAVSKEVAQFNISFTLDIILKYLSVEKKLERNISMFAVISISERALIEKFVKMAKKNQL